MIGFYLLFSCLGSGDREWEEEMLGSGMCRKEKMRIEGGLKNMG